uniref:ABC transmembrane type-2 domain-containing protein n=1 Tax=Pleonosporium borreri TaxID=2575635 RepID=A0A4D6WW46_9FLOR|nr:hypothetical protein [Pleonosporium borreri]
MLNQQIKLHPIKPISRNNLKPLSNITKKLKKYYFIQEIQALTKRLYLQILRKPLTVITGIIQPLIWLILFSALFQNAPIKLLQNNIQYNEFLNPGIIIFTAFTGSMNSGLTIIFDREFGFLNRLLVSPLKNRYSLLFSLFISTWSITAIQIFLIMMCNILLNTHNNMICYVYQILILATLIIITIASLSICLAFLLPGHIEFLACILISNLPILFSSTALAPLAFMPSWLQFLACLNPLTYAIEILRYLYSNHQIIYNTNIIKTIWITLSIKNSIIILLLINTINLIITQYILKYKYE